MLQVKTIYGTDPPNLNDSLNKELSQFTSKIVDIKFPNDSTAVIIYELTEEFENEICCDCQYWDDTSCSTNLIGFCMLCGKRKRFNEKACRQFKDVRK